MVRGMLLSVLALCACAIAAIMETKSVTTFTTERGITVVLKPDSTWEYQQEGREAIANDILEQLGDGRILAIRADGTYGFMEKNERTRVVMLGVKSIEANAMSINSDHNTAVAAAVKEIFAKMTGKINAAVYKGQGPASLIQECLKESAKDYTPVEQFNEQTKAWKITIDMKLYQDQVIAIAECVKEKKDEARAKADSIKAAKSGKSKAATAPAN